MHSANRLAVTVIVDNPDSWIIPYAQKLVSLVQNKHDVAFATDQQDVKKGDVAFYLGCTKITPKSILNRNKHNIVVHESALPQGTGFSPLTWQILEGKNSIPIVLFEAVEELDSGPIYIRDILEFEGHELIDEMREKQGNKTVELCTLFINMYPDIILTAQPQDGSASFYPRRTPQDSRLDSRKSIAEQFNLLRVVDNTRYPAFVEMNGNIYLLKIEKMSSESK